MTRVGLVGLGYWGPNLARNFDHLAELTWLCDTDEGNHRTFAARFPRARMTADYAEMLADPELDAVVVATRSRPTTRSRKKRSKRESTSSSRSRRR